MWCSWESSSNTCTRNSMPYTHTHTHTHTHTQSPSRTTRPRTGSTSRRRYSTSFSSSASIEEDSSSEYVRVCSCPHSTLHTHTYTQVTTLMTISHQMTRPPPGREYSQTPRDSRTSESSQWSRLTLEGRRLTWHCRVRGRGGSSTVTCAFACTPPVHCMREIFVSKDFMVTEIVQCTVSDLRAGYVFPTTVQRGTLYPQPSKMLVHTILTCTLYLLHMHEHCRSSLWFSPLSPEMPGLKLLRKKTCTTGDKPLRGARIVGCTHVTAKSAVSVCAPSVAVYFLHIMWNCGLNSGACKLFDHTHTLLGADWDPGRVWCWGEMVYL